MNNPGYNDYGYGRGPFADISVREIATGRRIHWRIPRQGPYAITSEPSWLDKTHRWTYAMFDLDKMIAHLFVGKPVWNAASRPLATLRHYTLPHARQGLGSWLFAGLTPGIVVLGTLTPDGSDLLLGASHYSFSPIHLYTFQTHARPLREREIAVSLPHGHPFFDVTVVFSSDSKRLAFHLDQVDYAEIITMNLDGSIIHILGTVRHTSPNEMAMRNLRWLPGGKQLSFEHGGSLWVVRDVAY
jgi:hypothetical protein